MCGVVGYLTAETDSNIETNIRQMNQTLHHRGPDSGSVWIDKQNGVGFGHRRLSVIDLSSHAKQPMQSSCGRYVLTYNGEIYNHLNLRKELDVSGLAPNWRGHSDTETLLAAISAWGLSKTLEQITGMFVFALWDKKAKQLSLARDRFGEKPLYYGWLNNIFVFGSELKSLQAHPNFNNKIDRDVLSLYFQYTCVPSPYSIFEDIYKLEPASVLTINAQELNSKEVNIDNYWNLADIARNGYDNLIHDEQEAITLLDDALTKSVSQMMMADVPVGAFLSGGIDSSTIVALMQKQSSRPVQTFTVGFEDELFDESKDALLIAKHLSTDHHELHVTASDAMKVIPYLADIYSEPFADSSQIPTYLVCSAARKNVTVALSGDAGDELFGGYNRYFWADRIWNKFGVFPHSLRNILGQGVLSIPPQLWDTLNIFAPDKYKVKRLGDKAHKLAARLKNVENIEQLYRSLITTWSRDTDLVIDSKLLSIVLDDRSLIHNISESKHQMMIWDSLNYLPNDILTKVDRAAMGVSLETRIPFLNHQIAELAWRLPMNMKVRNGQGKWILRQVLYKYIPPELMERPKSGFGIPVGDWLRGALREWAENLLDSCRIQKEGYLNHEIIHKIWSQHQSKRYDHSDKLWSILMFQSWLDKQL